MRSLQHFYGIEHWDIPADYLCPPIHKPRRLSAPPGGSAGDQQQPGGIPRGKGVAILDVGVSANYIYPIVGLREYGWRFTGSEIDPVSLNAAKMIVEMNPTLRNSVRLRLQKQPELILAISARPRNSTTLYSPAVPRVRAGSAPAPAASCINWAKEVMADKPVQNFGGKNNELWCRRAAKKPLCARWWKGD